MNDKKNNTKTLSKRVLAEQAVLDMGLGQFLNPEVWSTMSKEYFSYQDPKLFDEQTLDSEKNNSFAIKNEFENVPDVEEDQREKNRMWKLNLE